ncbi:hypothetical protein LTR08_008810 [Meristemomyces frigidus]|nr:hypothetical protein LTR08_008810 [Meristemomyces frigidus]
MSKERAQASGEETNTVESEQASSDNAPSELTLRSGLAVAGSALAYFISVGFLNAYGVFQQFYASEQNHLPDLRNRTSFQISWLGSFALFALFFFAPFSGLSADKFGPTLPTMFGSVALLVAMFTLSLCKTYWQFFLTQGLLLGIGVSFIAIPASGTVPRYFKRNRGLATGISVGGSSLGGILWPIAFDRMLHHDGIGFPWAVRIAGFTMLPLCCICVLTVRWPIRPNSAASPEEGSDPTTEKGTNGKKKDLSALKEPPFVLLCAGLFLAILGFFAPFFFVTTYAVSLGMSPSFSFYLVSIVNGASLFGRILPGIVADRWGRFNMLAASAFTAGIIAFCWTTATSVAGLVVWSAAYGFASGAILSLQLACATTLVDSDSAGAAVGAVMGSTSLATLFGTPIAGELVKYGYLALSCFSGAMLLAGASLIAASRLCQSRSLTARI